MNPVSKVLAALFAILVIAGAVIFGVFVLAAVAVLGFVAWIVFTIRGWWLRKKGVELPADSSPNQTEVIEAEYTVISRRRE
jgi:hypothetical protein